MMVIFTAQCEKKALPRTRRVLDAFANRIGERTWQTIITAQGLATVYQLLRRQATKNTAVACHWLRGRHHSELKWIVGNKRKFNAAGYVPVNTTHKNLLHNHWENNWHYLPLIKALVAMAALLHDWGKANDAFQEKLAPTASPVADPFRHEWVSCLLLRALVQSCADTTTDESWLMQFAHHDWSTTEKKLTTAVTEMVRNPDLRPLADLPFLAQWIGWLMLSHHSLPTTFEAITTDQKYRKAEALNQLLSYIGVNYGYSHLDRNKETVDQTEVKLEFSHGLLSQSRPWQKQLSKWANRLWQQAALAQEAQNNGAWRLILQHARACLILGDHYYSSCDADVNSQWSAKIKLWANTGLNPKTNIRQRKQKLDEHLVNVCKHALTVTQLLYQLSTNLAQAENKSLLKKSPAAYKWQDKAVTAIRQHRQQQPHSQQQGWFIVNMASTGQGKTIANAKIMQTLSTDGRSLRYILALGLRTLTLQTGDAYQQQLGLSKDGLAVLIGSQAVQDLHKVHHNKPSANSEEQNFSGSESEQALWGDELNVLDDVETWEVECMQTLFPPKKAAKHRALLYKPVLVCTIDHMMMATEGVKGGRHILPYLRLLSSDLVIDEVDDFDLEDLLAISRLVHLTGMLGRKVMLSSATIPPDLAIGLYHAYQHGWGIYQAFTQQESQPVNVMWIDEFGNNIQQLPITTLPNDVSAYESQHNAFIEQRLNHLRQQPSKQHAYIIHCEDLKSTPDQNELTVKQGYFSRIQQHIIKLHHHHHETDPHTGKHFSFGVVRMANIDPCVALTKFLLQQDDHSWSDEITPRIMVYHSREVMLLRSEQEHHLDKVLNRSKSPSPAPYDDETIRQHLQTAQTAHVIFIVIASPVEEIGRDHDFDWSIIEPSSMRSIIQMCGRILRHRDKQIYVANIGLLQYNLKGLLNKEIAFNRPGYEYDTDDRTLITKDLIQLINANWLDVEPPSLIELPLTKPQPLTQGINAAARIHKNQLLQSTRSLADLEHLCMQKLLNTPKNYGLASLQGWLYEYWFLTGLPQKFHRFRGHNRDIKVYYLYQQDNNSDLLFYECDQHGEWLKRQNIYKINLGDDLTPAQKQRLWLCQDYQTILQQYAHKPGSNKLFNHSASEQPLEEIMQSLSKRYGELTIADYLIGKTLYYSDYLGLYTE